MTTEKLMLNKHEIECQHIYMFFKRIFDIILSLIGLIVVVIPSLIISLFIYACDRGPEW